MARFTNNVKRKAERLNGTLVFLFLLIMLLVAAWWIGNPNGFEAFWNNLSGAFDRR